MNVIELDYFYECYWIKLFLEVKYFFQGARMVRELFEMARSKKACIIFFDEIDAVGGKIFLSELKLLSPKSEIFLCSTLYCCKKG